MLAERREPGEHAADGVLADAADASSGDPGLLPALIEALREALAERGDAGRAEQVGRRAEEGAAALRGCSSREHVPSSPRRVVGAAGCERELRRRRLGRPAAARRRLDARRVGARAPRAGGQPLRGAPASAARRARAVVRGAAQQRLADHLQGLPEAASPRPPSPAAPAQRGRARLAARQRASTPSSERLEGAVEARRAERVAGAVRGAPLDAVAPALDRAVDDRRGLAVVDRERLSLRRGDLLRSRSRPATWMTFQSCR